MRVKRWPLIAAIMQLLIGIAAVAAYVVVAVGGEPLGKWTITLLLAIGFVIMGILGVIDWKKERK